MSSHSPDGQQAPCQGPRSLEPRRIILRVTRSNARRVTKIKIRRRFDARVPRPVFSSNVLKELAKRESIEGAHATIPVFAYSHIDAQRHAEIKIPLQMDSPEMLVMAGFRAPAAAMICQLRRPNQTMLEAVQFWIDKRHENHYLGWTVKRGHNSLPNRNTKAQCAQAQHNIHQWRTTLLNLFLEDSMIDRLLDSRYEEIRMTQCSCFWVLDNVKQCIEFCNTVSQRVDHKEHRGDYDDKITGVSEQHNGKLIKDAAALGRSVYFKSGPISMLERCVNYDQTVTLEPLLEIGQFHAQHPGVYLVTDSRLAILRSDYIHRRLDFIDTAVLQVAISDSKMVNAVKTLKPVDVANLVVHYNPHVSRHEKVLLKSNIKSLGRLDGDDMVMGPISGEADHAFKTLDVRGYQGRFLFENDNPAGGPKQQLAIMSQQTRETLEEDLSAVFVWISSISATGDKGTSWDKPVEHY